MKTKDRLHDIVLWLMIGCFFLSCLLYIALIKFVVLR